MTTLKWIGLGFAVLALTAAALLGYGKLRWNDSTRELIGRLEAARVPPRPARCATACACR